MTHYPGHRFVRTSVVDCHHGVARYGWELRNPDGQAMLEGIDVGRCHSTNPAFVDRVESLITAKRRGGDVPRSALLSDGEG